ncbi:hypothetical protein M7775_19140 [Sporomusa sphaeroides DSM 2875]|uniref:hypothetical protein n=1 Tax=Sporomusa sphaeroides TaxID=47679 RepID=UPI00202FCC14|nr:hypothetical protein [Sporomusa sphaeroides]MCM0760669.1 hypothetical protein [Sporomusa sphaeroides DSM 2875]
MSKKTLITLITPVKVRSNEGVVRQEWQPAGKIPVTLLPVTQELAYKYHGYTKTVKKRGFYKGKNQNVKLGNGIMDGETPLIIVSALDYGKVIDFLAANPDES